MIWSDVRLECIWNYAVSCLAVHGLGLHQLTISLTLDRMLASLRLATQAHMTQSDELYFPDCTQQTL